jgi:hypothetical protein
MSGSCGERLNCYAGMDTKNREILTVNASNPLDIDRKTMKE